MGQNSPDPNPGSGGTPKGGGGGGNPKPASDDVRKNTADKVWKILDGKKR